VIELDDQVYNEAVLLYNTGEQSKALELFLQLAKQGHTDSMTALGYIYEQMDGEESHKAAFEWCKMTAYKGHPYAQYHLGRLYFEGACVKRNYKKSLTWYATSIANGVVDDVDERTRQDVKRAVDEENAGSLAFI